MENPNKPAPGAQNNTTPGDGKTPSMLAGASGAPAGDSGAAPADGGKAPEGGNPAGDPKPPEGNKPPEGAPEKYEFKFPEGVTVDQNLLSTFEPMAKELGLTQEKAQKFIDLYATHSKEIVSQQEKALESQRAEWRKTIQSQKGSDEMIGLAKKALNHFAKADPEVGTLFEGSWLGDHPSVVRLLSEAGKMLLEHNMIDGRATGGKPANEKKLSELMYPSMQKK